MRRKLLELKLPYNLTASAAKTSQQLLISVKHGKTEALLLNRIKREGEKTKYKRNGTFWFVNNVHLFNLYGWLPKLPLVSSALCFTMCVKPHPAHTLN